MRKSLPSEIPAEGAKWDEIQPDIENIIMVTISDIHDNVDSPESHIGNILNSSLGFQVTHRTLAS